jgi:hypothetical protein
MENDTANNPREQEAIAQLERLTEAENALRSNLHLHTTNDTARAHMERAMSHVREACVAINQPGQSRSVPRLVNDLEKVERLTEKLKRKHQSAIHH